MLEVPNSRADTHAPEQKDGVAYNCKHDEVVVHVVQEAYAERIPKLCDCLSQHAAVHTVERPRCQIGLGVEVQF